MIERHSDIAADAAMPPCQRAASAIIAIKRATRDMPLYTDDVRDATCRRDITPMPLRQR